MEIAGTEAEWQDLLARSTKQEALGIRSTSLAGVVGGAGALFFPDEAIVDPRDVTRALRSACQARHVRILEETRVYALRVTEHRVDAETSGGTFSAAAGVLAAGAWSGEIAVTQGGVRVETTPSFPVRGHLLGYTLPPGSLGPILRSGHSYLLQRASGFTIAGTSSQQVGFDRTLDPGIIIDIHAHACELMPQLRSAPSPEAWLGFRPATADFEPRIGRLNDTALWLAYGHYRNGILLAPATALRVSRELMSSSEMGSHAPGASR